MLALDVSRAKRDKNQYQEVRRAEAQYGVKLRKLARHIGDIIRGFPPGDPAALPAITKLLRDYAKAITPWANATAGLMLADVAHRDKRLWANITKGMSLGLRMELERAPTGATLRDLQAQQVRLITSLPIEAAERVHKLTYEGLANATRAKEVAAEIMRSGHVTESRATLIARTEVARASSNLGQARAQHVGSEGYIWRTAGDSDVRESHRKLEGTFHRWSSPPICDPPSHRAHPGCIWNCRCYAEIVLPDHYLA
jgi:SPP1 gp7 family putative phage head morphogenesis protein